MVMVVVGLLVLFTLGRPQKRSVSIEQKQAREGIPVSVTRPKPMSFQDYFACDGSVVALDRAMLRTKVEEVVEAVHVRVGETVKKGQVLVKFRTTDLEADIAAAETAFQEAQRNFERYQSLAEQRVVSQEQLDLARTRRDAAQARLTTARSRLDFATIDSPLDGEVEGRFVDPGEQKGVGKELLSIINLETVEVSALVPEAEVKHVTLGEQAEFQTDATDDWQTGQVSRISPSTSDPNRFYEVFLRVPNRKAGGNWVFRPGMFARVRFLRRTAEGLGLPVNALLYEGNQQVAFAVVAGTAQVPPAPPKEDTRSGFFARLARGAERLQQLAAKAKANSNADPGAQLETVQGLVAKRLLVVPGIQSGDFVHVTDRGLAAETQVIVNPRNDIRDGTLLQIAEGGA
jgi:membrane fusion protein (multidrug efflux system)